MAASDLAKDLSILRSGRIVPGCTNPPELSELHQQKTEGKMRFRFPPEPNGFLHIGHAKSMRLNFGTAAAVEGQCYLRYDDTNPESEERLYIDAIHEMVLWLGYRPFKVTFASDYFSQLHDFAVQLIRQGDAYIDHSTVDEIKRQREGRQPSPWRDRPMEESLRLFRHMRQGRFGEGEATLRLKMDFSHDNPNMRDIIAYRVKFTPHPRTGDAWVMYPSYDFTHCVVDSLEEVDFSLCTLEFETRRESYFWLLERLSLFRPYVWEFSRLQVGPSGMGEGGGWGGAVLSKRKINELVKAGVVRGFDDPRLLTLAGLRRRGCPPDAINTFCDRIGITRATNVIQVAQLEAAVRELLDARCLRRLMVVDKLRVRLHGEGIPDAVSCANIPRDLSKGTRVVPFSEEIWIDKGDFREDGGDDNFYGLVPGGRFVGLKYAGSLRCTSFERDDKSGAVCLVHCDYDGSREVKPKTNISWVCVRMGVEVEVRLYTPLLKREQENEDTLASVDIESEKIQHGVVEPCVAHELALWEAFQAERFGYFAKDSDSNSTRLVLNRVIELKEEKGKTQLRYKKK